VKRVTFYLVVVMLCVFGFSLLDTKAYCVSPVEPGDNWFSVAIHLDEKTLPAGVQLVEDKSVKKTSLGRYHLNNKTSESIYIVSEGQKHPNSGLPNDISPIYRLVDNSVYGFNGSIYNGDPWEEYCKNCRGLPIINILRESQQVWKVNRPLDVKIPQPQQVEIPVYYNGDTFNISGQLVYGLNEEYNPETPFPPCNDKLGLNFVNSTLPEIIAVVMFLALVTTVFAVFFIVLRFIWRRIVK